MNWFVELDAAEERDWLWVEWWLLVFGWVSGGWPPMAPPKGRRATTHHSMKQSMEPNTNKQLHFTKKRSEIESCFGWVCGRVGLVFLSFGGLWAEHCSAATSPQRRQKKTNKPTRHFTLLSFHLRLMKEWANWERNERELVCERRWMKRRERVVEFDGIKWNQMKQTRHEWNERSAAPRSQMLRGKPTQLNLSFVGPLKRHQKERKELKWWSCFIFSLVWWNQTLTSCSIHKFIPLWLAQTKSKKIKINFLCLGCAPRSLPSSLFFRGPTQKEKKEEGGAKTTTTKQKNWLMGELIRWSWMSVMGQEHITLYPVIKEKIYLFFMEGAAHNSSTHQSTQPKKIKQFNFLFGFINWFIYELKLMESKSIITV